MIELKEPELDQSGKDSTIVECFVDYIGIEKALCQMRLNGTLLAIELPSEVLAAYNLQPNMRFRWNMQTEDDGPVRVEDIEPIN